MTSSMCTAHEHDSCGRIMQTAPGKTFKCDCQCHKPVRKVIGNWDGINVVEDWEGDQDE